MPNLFTGIRVAVHRRVGDHVDCMVVAITVSILAICAVYIAMIADEQVGNATVAVTVLAAAVAAAFAWGAWWSSTTKARFEEQATRIDDLEASITVHNLLNREPSGRHGRH